MKDFWESRYQSNDFAYGKTPNLFFKDTIDQLEPGKIFLPGEGEGRNAVYAAESGWTVEAMDLTEAGRKKALQLASDSRVNITYKTGDLLNYHLEPETYDFIALIYLHMPPSVRTTIHRKLLEALKKSGVLILEAFTKKQMGQLTGGPQNLDMLFDESILRSDFQGLSIESLYETEQVLNEGPFHQGKSYQIRMIARKS
ncbi:class I SAM-dependent methyltransferase [Bacteroidota bacterium]